MVTGYNCHHYIKKCPSDKSHDQHIMIDTAQSYRRTHTRKNTKAIRSAFDISTFFVSANMQGSDETATPESLLTKTQSIEVDENSYQA